MKISDAIKIFETEVSTIDVDDEDPYLQDIRQAMLLGIDALRIIENISKLTR